MHLNVLQKFYVKKYYDSLWVVFFFFFQYSWSYFSPLLLPSLWINFLPSLILPPFFFISPSGILDPAIVSSLC